MIDSKALSVELVLHAKEVSTIVDVVRWCHKIWTSFDGSFCDIKEQRLVREFDGLTIVNHSLRIVGSILMIYHTSEDHDFLASNLSSSCMDDSQLKVVSDIIHSLPNILFNVECFNLLNVIKGQFPTYSSFWFQAFSADNENVLLIKLANAESLPWFIKVWQHYPFLA